MRPPFADPLRQTDRVQSEPDAPFAVGEDRHDARPEGTIFRTPYRPGGIGSAGCDTTADRARPDSSAPIFSQRTKCTPRPGVEGNLMPSIAAAASPVNGTALRRHPNQA